MSTLETGATGRAAVPSGASTGAHEAAELRDGDKARYGGKGVLQAVANVEGEIFDAIGGMEAAEQVALDEIMIDLDGTPNKSRLGANAILAVSLAVAKAAAEDARPAALPLRRRRVRAHLAGADDEHHQWRPARRQPDRHPGIHDPAGRRRDRGRRRPDGLRDLPQPEEGAAATPATTPTWATRAASRPNLQSADEALGFIARAVEKAGYRPGEDVTFALDCAATEFSRDGRYELEGEGKSFDAGGMVAYLDELCRRYPIVSIEDGCAEDDWDGWAHLTERLGERVQLVGDDLFVTNPERLRRGIEAGTANSILVKVNQIGTLSETLEAVEMAHRPATPR